MSLFDVGASDAQPAAAADPRPLAYLLALLRRFRYPIGTEAALQLAVARVLTTHAIRFERELVIDPTNRLDFYLPDWKAALELKTQGSVAEVTRQLYRYTADARVDVVVLLTSRHTHARVPREMHGKRVEVITPWEGAL